MVVDIPPAPRPPSEPWPPDRYNPNDGYHIRPYSGPEPGKFRYEIWKVEGKNEALVGCYLHYRHVRQTIIGLEKTLRRHTLRAQELGCEPSIFLPPREEDYLKDPNHGELWAVPTAEVRG